MGAPLAKKRRVKIGFREWCWAAGIVVAVAGVSVLPWLFMRSRNVRAFDGTVVSKEPVVTITKYGAEANYVVVARDAGGLTERFEVPEGLYRAAKPGMHLTKRSNESIPRLVK